jgi:hypothetical protein
MPRLSIDRSFLERLLSHATSAERLVGHVDDAVAAVPLTEHVDVVVHKLTELLGDRRALTILEAAAPAYDGAPMLAAGTEVAR